MNDDDSDEMGLTPDQEAIIARMRSLHSRPPSLSAMATAIYAERAEARQQRWLMPLRSYEQDDDDEDEQPGSLLPDADAVYASRSSARQQRLPKG